MTKQGFPQTETIEQLMRLITILMAISLFIPSYRARAQEYLSEQEIDQIREAQSIDQRTKAFIYIADRRLRVLTEANPTQSKKDEEKWGPMPKGAPAQMLIGYKRAINELMDKLEDNFEREKSNEALGKALRALAEALDRQLKVLESLQSKFTDEAELAALTDAVAVAKVAKEGALENAALIEEEEKAKKEALKKEKEKKKDKKPLPALSPV